MVAVETVANCGPPISGQPDPGVTRRMQIKIDNEVDIANYIGEALLFQQLSIGFNLLLVYKSFVHKTLRETNKSGLVGQFPPSRVFKSSKSHFLDEPI
jgi:hypothetical protein